MTICILLGPVYSAQSAVGTIPGESAVSPGGAATYAIPLQVVPGIAGMQPSLSLQYSSQSGDGVAGVGWEIGGLSRIHRCPQTYEQDNAYRGVRFDVDDRYCLDGRRLIAVDGDYGASGTGYRTEIDEYSRIVQNGAGCGGPCSFTVQTRAGQTFTYGATADAFQNIAGHSGAWVWAVNHIEDSVGNWVDFRYTENRTNNTQLVTRIRYGGSGLLAGSVDFQYSARPDPARQYLYGARIYNPHRLAAIRTRNATGALVRRYLLGYEQSPSNGRSLLVSLQACGPGSPADCLATTRFDWYGGRSAYGRWEQSGSAFPANLDKCRRITAGDADGDGRTDIICAYDTDNSGSNATITYVQRATSDGYRPWENWHQSARSSFKLANCRFFSTADLNADGVTDLVCKIGNNTYVQTSNGSRYSAWQIWSTGADPACIVKKVADVDGDGRSDLLCAGVNDTWVELSRGTSLSGWTHWAGNTGGPGNPSRCRHRFARDVNGDGLTDAVCLYDTTESGFGANRTYVQLATGSGFMPWQVWRQSSVLDLEQCARVVAADFNADGLTDFACVKGAAYYVQLSKGTAYADWQNWGNDSAVTLASCMELIATDADGDGRADLICAQNASGGLTYVKRARSDADGFGNWEVWSLSPVTGSNCRKMQAADVQGNNMPDLVCVGNDKFTYTQLYKYGAAGGSVRPAGYTPRDPALSQFVFLSGDLLESIDDGQGQPTEFVYATLADSTVYDPDLGATCPGYPILCRSGNRYVVAETRIDNGIGGQRLTGYHYKRGRSHLRGRGWLGFGEVTATDADTGIATITAYHELYAQNRGQNNYLFAANGLPVYEIVTLEDGTAVSRRRSFQGAYAFGTLMRVRLGLVIEDDYELDGSLIKTVTTYNYSFDIHNNPTFIRVTTKDAQGNQYFTNDTRNVYYNDTSRWLLGRLTRAEVTHSGANGTDTRTSSFEYHPTTGLLTAETVEPDDSELTLRTANQYDNFGNKTAVTVSDSGSATYPVSPRTSTDTYDYTNLAVDGTYRLISTNAKGHTETKVIDARFGKVKSLTGPNGLTTTWNYDAFGRKVLEQRADGTQTRWTRSWCDSACPPRALYRVKVTTSGSAPVTTYYDALDREVRSETVGLNGRTIYKDSRYDSRGRLAAESRNYFEGDTVYWTTYAYDDLDRVVEVRTPDGGVAETYYSGLVTTIRNYDLAGTFDQTTVQTVNVLGEEVSLQDAAGNTLYKFYDAFGNLRETRDPAGNSTRLTYDRRGRKIAMDDPDMGHWEYRYDALGQLRWQKDAKGQVATLTYDVLGRRIQRTEPEGTSTWSYDIGFKAIGKLSRVQGPAFNRYLSYDSLGRQSGDVRNLDGTWLWMSTAYDTLGRVGRIIYPGGFSVKNSYDDSGYLIAVSSGTDNSIQYWQAGDSDADGHVTLATLGSGEQTVRLYEPFSGRLQGTSTGPAGETQFFTYRWDALGNLRERRDENRQLTETFAYDALNRLSSVNLAGIGVKRYRYDALGNITAKGTVADYRYGENSAGPHAVTRAGGQTYRYDANGNMTDGGGRRQVWTSYNKPGWIYSSQGGWKITTFRHDPEHNRFSRYEYDVNRPRQTSTTLYFDKFYEQVNFQNGNTVKKHYIYAGSEAVAIQEQYGSVELTKYLHRDHLGSVSAVTLASDTWAVTDAQSFDAFGARRPADSWQDPAGTTVPGLDWATTRGFTGHEQIDNFQLVHMNGRVYDPTLGRFLSADSQVQFAGNLQSYNRYSYAHNNPLSFTDPSGFGLFSKLKKGFKKLLSNDFVRLGLGIALAYFATPYAALLASTIVNPTVAYAVGGFVGGFALGGITSGTLQGALIGGLSGAAFAAVGHAAYLEAARNAGGGLGSVALHGGVGGAFARAQGASFREGFLSAAVTKFANLKGEYQSSVANTVKSAVVGGVSAELGGGKFINGAKTGAFSYLFNDKLDDLTANGSRIEMRRVGDRLFPVRVFECATAECVARGANLDLNDPGTQAYIEASNAKGLSDLGTAASIVILKSPTGIVGNTAARTSLAADVAKTAITGNPASMIPAITGRFAQGIAETNLGVNNAATINRIGAGTGLVVDQVINDE